MQCRSRQVHYTVAATSYDVADDVAEVHCFVAIVRREATEIQCNVEMTVVELAYVNCAVADDCSGIANINCGVDWFMVVL